MSRRKEVVPHFKTLHEAFEHFRAWKRMGEDALVMAIAEYHAEGWLTMSAKAWKDYRENWVLPMKHNLTYIIEQTEDKIGPVGYGD